MRRSRLIFVTGTDTGVGKTVFTGLLLAHLRRLGHKALAIKPFCSGDQGDAALLMELQDRQLPLAEVNPWFFPQPVAPLVAARTARRQIGLSDVVAHVKAVAHRSDTLLIEGAGGLLAPLGETYSALELIRSLRPHVIVVASNKLGTINHTLLTVQALRAAKIRDWRVVLMEPKNPDLSSKSNAKVLCEMLGPGSLIRLPYLGARASRAEVLCNASARLRARLSRTLE